MNQILIAILLLFTAAIAKERTYGNIKKVHVVSVHDGDTFKVQLPASYPAIIRDSMPIRVYGENTPELHVPDSAAAVVARDSVKAWIARAGNTVDLLNLGRDKYFRLDADVRLKIGGKYVSLADTLIKAGLAVPYFGGKK